MIPRTIHYTWFGGGELPALARECIESWHRLMPDWEYRLWNEENFDVARRTYTREAYAQGRYAFVSDVARLEALYREGGVYLDVDFEVFRPFDDLLANTAFAGFEGSKHLPVMMGVCGSEAGGRWVKEMLDAYEGRPFVVDGKADLTPNVTFLSGVMRRGGLVQNGREQYYKDLHVYPVDYFCPRQTTGEYLRTANTYCDHRGLNSWSDSPRGWKQWVKKIVGEKAMIHLIKTKRKLTECLPTCQNK